MSLPVFQDDNHTLMLLQSSWKPLLDKLLNGPFANGLLLKSVSLATGANAVNHLLQRNLQGWLIVRQRAAATVYDTQDSNKTPGLTLSLTASAPVVVDLFVF